jgi:hypothetical protein
VLPELEQRRRQQRQRGRLALDVGEQRVDEVGLDAQAGAARGQLDRAAQLVAAHRPDEHVVGAQQPRQLRVGGAAAVEVGAHTDQHERAAARVAGAGDERVDERGPLDLLAAGGERLLELVDRDDQPAVRRGLGHRLPERAQRVLAGAQERQRPSLAARQHAGGQRCEQARAQRGGLAAARRPDDAQQRRAGQARHHLGHEPLAPEEDPGVVDVERSEPLERAGHDAGLSVVALGTPADRLQLYDLAGDVVLGGAQGRAFGGRAIHGGAQAPRGLRARPLAGGAVHALRDAAAGLDQPRDRDLGVLARVQPRDGGHAIGVERRERQRRLHAQLGGKRAVLARRHDEHRQRGQPLEELGERRA